MADQPAATSQPAGASSPAPATEAAAAASPVAAAPAAAPAPQQPELVAANHPDEHDDGADDADSALGDDNLSNTTASVASSILEYRNIQGRTFHAERHNANYFTPNDDQQQESVDITHHYLTLLLDNKLHLAPLSKDIEKVLDVGTGTGIWAIDFADEYPNASIIGTDLSPIQPSWVPPNLKFEIDDATLPWTWDEDTFDFVHMRYLFGAITDWNALFAQAYRCTKPGGWTQTGEVDVYILSDDGTVAEDSAMYNGWSKLYTEGAKKLGRSFSVVKDDLQRAGLEAAGFVDIQHADFKLPVGGWPRDLKLAEVGEFVQLTMLNDIEGYTLFLWNTLLNWPKDEYQMFLMQMRKELRSRRIHGYMTVRYVWGRKPEGGAPAAT